MPRNRALWVPTSRALMTLWGAAYERAKQLWMSQIEAYPDNTAILGNAARLLTLCDKTKCGELLRRAKALEPDNPRWTERLADLYALEMIGQDSAAKRDWAAMTLAEYQSGQGLYRDERARLGQLPPEWLTPRSRQATTQRPYLCVGIALPGRRGRPGHGHLLRQPGSRATRPRRRRCGGRQGTPDSLRGNHRVPDPMQFRTEHGACRGLLARGERDVVLDYLGRCSSFWQHGADQLSRWAGAIERGETPDFGPRA